MLPDRLIVRLFLTRAAIIWLLVRAVVSAVLFLAGLLTFPLTVGTLLIVIAGTFALGIVDMTRRHERALLENLGVSRAMWCLFFVLPPVVGEALLGVAMRAL